MVDDRPVRPVSPADLEPEGRLLLDWLEQAGGFLADFVDGLPKAAALGAFPPPDLVDRLSQPPGREPAAFGDLLDVVGAACATGMETAGPGNMALVPGGGLVSAAVAELIAAATNRLTSLSAAAPGMVAMEDGVMRWLCGLFGLPAGTATGVSTTGGSMSSLTALVAAREAHVAEDLGGGVIYVGENAHPCIAKAARIAGFTPDQIEVVPATRDVRLDTKAAEALIRRDREAGRRPFLLVATAGTTDTGVVDDLSGAADIAARHGLWLHVDAAYGGFFRLTERGSAKLAGIHRADSVALNAHKSLFLPYGTGVLLVRDKTTLQLAFGCPSHCLRDVQGTRPLPDYADLGLELTRDNRGLRMWLPLHLHGTDAFTRALDEKLDLAAHAHAWFDRDPRFHAPWPPDLATVAFRVRGFDDAAHEDLLTRINTAGRIALSSTRIDGRVTLRMCLLNHRTHRDTVDEALAVVDDAVRRPADRAPSRKQPAL